MCLSFMFSFCLCLMRVPVSQSPTTYANFSNVLILELVRRHAHAVFTLQPDEGGILLSFPCQGVFRSVRLYSRNKADFSKANGLYEFPKSDDTLPEGCRRTPLWRPYPAGVRSARVRRTIRFGNTKSIASSQVSNLIQVK